MGVVMNFSKLNQQKDKFFIFLVAAFVFLSLFFVFDPFNKKSILVYIWAILYSIVLLYSGVIYGFMTKLRNRAMAIGFSFPLLFGIFLSIYLSSNATIQTEDSVTFIHYNFALIFIPLLFIAITNAIACWFASTTEEDKGKRKEAYFVSLVFMALPILMILFLIYV